MMDSQVKHTQYLINVWDYAAGKTRNRSYYRIHRRGLNIHDLLVVDDSCIPQVLDKLERYGLRLVEVSHIAKKIVKAKNVMLIRMSMDCEDDNFTAYLRMIRQTLRKSNEYITQEFMVLDGERALFGLN